jgi:peptide/nickel transport system permease protein
MATANAPAAALAVEPESIGRLHALWTAIRRKPLGAVSAAIIAVLVLTAIFADVLAPYDPLHAQPEHRLSRPSQAHPFGTDDIGRDVLSRIIHGARISLIVGLAAVAVSLVVGVTLGLLSGFLHGRVDTVIMTIVDVQLSFPQLLLALAFVAALGPSLVTIIVVLGLTGWERYTRVVRAEVLALREKDFVEAARAMGVSTARMILRHLLPNTFSSIIVLSTLQVAQAILQEAALSFLGVGTGTAYPTWGQMISLGRDFVSVAWWLPTFPGLAILLTVLAINLVGDRLRDALDPRVQ